MADLISKTPSKVMLKITDIPFYAAEDAFAHEKYETAIPLMVNLARHGNLYAAYYVDYVLHNQELLKFIYTSSLTTEELNYITIQFPAYFKLVEKFNDDTPGPQLHLNNWLRTTLLHQKIIKHLSTTAHAIKETTKQYEELLNYVPYCSKAYVLVKKFIQESPNGELSRKFIRQKLKFKGLDLYYLLSGFYLEPEQDEYDLKFIAQLNCSSVSEPWNIERLICEHYIDLQQLAALPPRLNNRFAFWREQLAYMGNPDALYSMLTNYQLENDRARIVMIIIAFLILNSTRFIHTSQSTLDWAQALAICGYDDGEKLTKKNPALAELFAYSLASSNILSHTWEEEDPSSQLKIAYALLKISFFYINNPQKFMSTKDVNAEAYIQKCSRLCQNDVPMLELLFSWYASIDKNYTKALGYAIRLYQLGQKQYMEKIGKIYFIGDKQQPRNPALAKTYFLRHKKEAVVLDDDSEACLAYLHIKDKEELEMSLKVLKKLSQNNNKVAINLLFQVYIELFLSNLNSLLISNGLTPVYIANLFKLAFDCQEYTQPYTNEYSSQLHYFYGEFLLITGNIEEKSCWQQAYSFFQQGVKLGQPAAFSALAQYFFSSGCSLIDIPQDYEKAYEYYDRALQIEKNMSSAMVGKATLIIKGLVKDKDIANAKSLLEDALKLGGKYAAYHLAMWYKQYGVAGSANDQVVFQYLEQLKDYSCPEALLELARCYVDGIGVPVDINLARKYLDEFAKIEEPIQQTPTGAQAIPQEVAPRKQLKEETAVQTKTLALSPPLKKDKQPEIIQSDISPAASEAGIKRGDPSLFNHQQEAQTKLLPPSPTAAALANYEKVLQDFKCGLLENLSLTLDKNKIQSYLLRLNAGCELNIPACLMLQVILELLLADGKITQRHTETITKAIASAYAASSSIKEKLRFNLEYIQSLLTKKHGQITYIELFGLLDEKIDSFIAMEKYCSQCSSTEPADQQSTAAGTSQTHAQMPASRKAAATLETMQQFIAPQNLKEANFEQFKKIVSQLHFILPGTQVQYRHANGSGEHVKINFEGDTTACCFGFHDLHHSGKGRLLDRNRAAELQRLVKDLLETIKDKQQQGKEPAITEQQGPIEQTKQRSLRLKQKPKH